MEQLPSTTILNYCKIGPELIDFVSDTTPIKQNKYTPGMHIPVKPYEDFLTQKPEIAVLFAWNHKEIENKEKNSLRMVANLFLIFLDFYKLLLNNYLR